MAREWKGGGTRMVPDEDDNPPEGYVFSDARGPFTSHNSNKDLLRRIKEGSDEAQSLKGRFVE